MCKGSICKLKKNFSYIEKMFNNISYTILYLYYIDIPIFYTYILYLHYILRTQGKKNLIQILLTLI